MLFLKELILFLFPIPTFQTVRYYFKNWWNFWNKFSVNPHVLRIGIIAVKSWVYDCDTILTNYSQSLHNRNYKEFFHIVSLAFSITVAKNYFINIFHQNTKIENCIKLKSIDWVICYIKLRQTAKLLRKLWSLRKGWLLQLLRKFITFTYTHNWPLQSFGQDYDNSRCLR